MEVMIFNRETTMEISAVVSPSISGDLNRIYVVYRKASEKLIRTKYRINGGSSWSYLASNPSNSNAASIECEFSEGNLAMLHIDWKCSVLQLL